MERDDMLSSEIMGTFESQTPAQIAQPSQASNKNRPIGAGVSPIFGSISIESVCVCVSHPVKAKQSKIEAIALK